VVARRYFRPTMFSLLASAFFSYLCASSKLVARDRVSELLLWGFWLFCAVIAISVLLAHIGRAAFHSTGPIGLGDLIGHYLGAYGGIMLVFAGLYFSICMYEDHKWADYEFTFHNQIQIASSPNELAGKGDVPTSKQIADALQKLMEQPMKPDAGGGIGPRRYRLWHTLGFPANRPDGMPLDVPMSRPWDVQTASSSQTVRMPKESVVVPASAVEMADVFIDCCYFSMITISTLGYGDMVPLTRYARTAAITESFLGVFVPSLLIGILISRLERKPHGKQDGNRPHSNKRRRRS
jgi:Ion channel